MTPPDENLYVISLSKDETVKRTPLEAFGTQKRGGKGVMATKTGEHGYLQKLHVASPDEDVLLFTNQSKCYKLRASDVPEMGRYAKGKPADKVLELEPGERITGCISVRGLDDAHGYLVTATKRGMIKRTDLSDFGKIRAKGVKAIKVAEGDELVGVSVSDGSSQIFMATRSGRAIRFDESDVRASGRTAGGVRGINLAEADEVASFMVAAPTAMVFTITENGYGKRTPMSDYRQTARGGKGVTNVKNTEKAGRVVSSMAVGLEDEVLAGSKSGKMIRFKAADVRQTGRGSTGVRVMKTEGDDGVVTASLIQKGSDTPAGFTAPMPH
jgi:DNA gyrase subunit A